MVELRGRGMFTSSIQQCESRLQMLNDFLHSAIFQVSCAGKPCFTHCPSKHAYTITES